MSVVPPGRNGRARCGVLNRPDMPAYRGSLRPYRPSVAPRREVRSETSSGAESEPRAAADAGHGERACGERGAQHSEGVPVVVERLLVDQLELATEPRDVTQQLGDRRREAEIDERLCRPAVADSERSITRHAGDDALVWVDDAEVVQPCDVDPVADELAELLRRLGLARFQPERERLGTPEPVIGRRCMPRRGLAVARARRRQAIPHDSAGDTLLDEGYRSLRRPLEIEPLRESAAVERVVHDRDLRVEEPLPEPAGEVAAALEQAEAAEGVDREVGEE